MTTIRLGHRADPDEAFKFAALRGGEITGDGLGFEVVAADGEELFSMASRGDLDVVSLGVPGYAKLAERFRPLTTGGAAGDGVGPLIVSNRVFIEDELGGDTTIHVPGEHETGYLVLKLYAPACSVEFSAPSSALLSKIVDEDIESAVLSDESQITFANCGLYKVEDLGEWWTLNHDGLPLPLSLLCVRRDLDESRQKEIQRLVRRSVEWGMDHHEVAFARARDLGRDVDEYAAERMVAQYVNLLTRELGEAGIRGLERLLERGAAASLVPGGVPLDFVPHEE